MRRLFCSFSMDKKINKHEAVTNHLNLAADIQS